MPLLGRSTHIQRLGVGLPQCCANLLVAYQRHSFPFSFPFSSYHTVQLGRKPFFTKYSRTKRRLLLRYPACCASVLNPSTHVREAVLGIPEQMMPSATTRMGRSPRLPSLPAQVHPDQLGICLLRVICTTLWYLPRMCVCRATIGGS